MPLNYVADRTVFLLHINSSHLFFFLTIIKHLLIKPLTGISKSYLIMIHTIVIDFFSHVIHLIKLRYTWSFPSLELGSNDSGKYASRTCNLNNYINRILMKLVLKQRMKPRLRLGDDEGCAILTQPSPNMLWTSRYLFTRKGSLWSWSWVIVLLTIISGIKTGIMDIFWNWFWV